MFELTAASGRARRLGAIGSLAAFLLLSACDSSKLGWPDNLAGSGFGVAFAQTGIQYLAAFHCGSNQDPDVPGQYAIMVNIYNPSGGTISVTRRATLSIPSGLSRNEAISTSVNMDIGAVRAMQVDCDTIRSDSGRGSPASFISGVLVLESGVPVEVIATYTAGGLGGIDSIDVERILAR